MGSKQLSVVRRERPPRPPPPSVDRAAMGSRNSGPTYFDLRRQHDVSFQLINEALSLDELGKNEEALRMYLQALEAIKTAMAIVCPDDQLSADERNSAQEMQHKLTKSKLQVESRMEALQQTTHCPSYLEATSIEVSPPPYEEAMISPSSPASDIGDSIMMVDGASSHRRCSTDATEIFCIPQGVQIFFVAPGGFVSAPSYPDCLKILKFNQSEEGAQPPAFLQIGDWIYPLVPGTSPVLHTSYGAYMFPDVIAPQEGCAVGVLLPDDVSDEDRQRLEHYFHTLTVFQQQTIAPTEETKASAPPEKAAAPVAVTAPTSAESEEKLSTKVAKGIETFAGAVVWGLNKGAEKGAELMKKGSQMVISKTKPEKQKEINEHYQAGVQNLRTATHCVVRVSGYVISKLGEATVALGRTLSPHIQEHGKKLLPKSITESRQTASKVDAVMEVAASGLKGFGLVYTGLESAGKHLARSLANETVQIVNYKYGTQAGAMTENALYSVGNVAMTAHHVNHLGVKAIAKRAAKDTGIVVVEDYNARHHKATKASAADKNPS